MDACEHGAVRNALQLRDLACRVAFHGPEQQKLALEVSEPIPDVLEGLSRDGDVFQ